MNPDLELKQQQFNNAMDLYTGRPIYKIIGKTVSVMNVSMQAYLLVRVLAVPIAPLALITAFLLAMAIADFLNGLVHMYMDNNDDYQSFAGPLVAAFHLHHMKPMYRKNPVWLVYFNESGSKLWLPGYLLAVALLAQRPEPNAFLLHTLFYVGILSSVAEVSHYLCHTSTSWAAMFLGRAGLLLPKRHHAEHHTKDNVNYAFLNGWTDPLINMIAQRLYPGYKNTTDRHFAHYAGLGTDNR